MLTRRRNERNNPSGPLPISAISRSIAHERECQVCRETNGGIVKREPAPECWRSASAQAPRLLRRRESIPRLVCRCGLALGDGVHHQPPPRARDRVAWSTHGSREAEGWLPRNGDVRVRPSLVDERVRRRSVRSQRRHIQLVDGWKNLKRVRNGDHITRLRR